MAARQHGTNTSWTATAASPAPAGGREKTGRKTGGDRQRGAFLILAAVFLLIVLAFLGVVFLTTFTTSTSTSLNEVQSTRALFVAEGGVEFARRDLSLDANWYWNPDPTALSGTLGSGQFTADISYPATALRKNIGAASPSGELRVFSVGRFGATGAVYAEGEIITYTGTATLPDPPGNRFTGVARGQWGTAAGPHGIGVAVSPVTRLSAAAGSGTGLTLTVGDTTKFLWTGTVTINPDDPLGDCADGLGGTTEDVDYRSFTQTTLVGVDLLCAHLANELVIPSESLDQAGIAGTGTVGTSQRQVRSIVQR